VSDLMISVVLQGLYNKVKYLCWWLVYISV